MQINQLDLLIDKIFPFMEPSVRLFYLYSVPSLLIALIWAYRSHKTISDFKSYIIHPSHRYDLQLYLLNNVLKVFLFGGLTLSSFKLTLILSRFFDTFTSFEKVNIPYPSVIILYSLLTFIIDDFLRFFHHYLMHKIPFLWKIHKTHHSCEVMSPLSLYRIHPLEVLIAMQRNILSTALSLTIVSLYFTHRMEIWTILGVHGIGFIFNLMMSNLRHSHIPISFGFIEKVFLSPKQHQIHHSTAKEHLNKNMGVTLAIWDILFGTYKESKNQNIEQFGLGKPVEHNLKSLLTDLRK